MNKKDITSDRIILNGIQLYGFHGCNDFERKLGQKFIVDVEVELSLKTAANSDDINDTVSYSHLFRTVKSVFEGPPRNLIETVANQIAHNIIKSFPVEAVTIRVMKTSPPIKKGFMDSAGVDISLRREGDVG